MAIALCEAGARAVYCFDLPEEPSEVFVASREYVSKLRNNSRLEYFAAGLEEIGDKEQRLDVCVAAAGILKPHMECLEYPANVFREVMEVNTTGVLFTAQAAGRQMARFGRGGSIILIASMSGSITNRDHAWVSYNSSKSAVLQMARSMACELGEQRIRVNSLSPGHIYTQYVCGSYVRGNRVSDEWLRGVVTWLASDASTFCTGSE
ncbi:hypothetical protein F5141DRAFT_1117364 [Pisolithus sp. B1]|nr:hypothetical protein F5141DRAFT_1117364 [Pisolithus sp. B1]